MQTVAGFIQQTTDLLTLQEMSKLIEKRADELFHADKIEWPRAQ